MDGNSVTAPQGEQRIAYRSHAVWFWPVFWPIAIALRWSLGWDAGGPMALWIVGIALLEANAVLTALRARRGLTLTAQGITWHKYEMRLSWANVTAVEQSARRGGARLIVRVGESGQALEDVAVPARPEIHANLRRFGAPIALRAGHLARPAAEVVEIADRLRREYEPPSGLKGFVTRDTPPEVERARRSARRWIRLASAGSSGFDVLAFDGPGFRDVADVEVTVRHKERAKRPSGAAEELHARRLLGTRFTEFPQDFDTLLLHNTNGVTVAVRVVCILWENLLRGRPQMVRSLPIGGLISIAPFDDVRVPVTGPVRKLARGCGSVKVYYSRPAPPVSM